MGRHPDQPVIPTHVLQDLLLRFSGFLANPGSHVLVLTRGGKMREQGRPTGHKSRRLQEQRLAPRVSSGEGGGSDT